ncbi:hypothetical protein MMC30_007461 [Trapelia coarctata]|nr:hypothetical protein [Trapelia coarctata]
MPTAMSSETPEKGDQVSWSYGGAKPTGEVVEKKTDGELSIQSKKGNTIKRKGDPENPAVHMAREGNDVVKKQSELTVEEKADEKDEEEPEANGDEDEGEESVTGTKRVREDDDEEEEKPVKKSRGRPKGITKATPAKKATTGTGKRGRPTKPDSEKKVAAPKSDGPKKGRGRPKKEEGAEPKAAKEKKEPKAKATPKKKATPATTGVGSRTRSRK